MCTGNSFFLGEFVGKIIKIGNLSNKKEWMFCFSSCGLFSPWFSRDYKFIMIVRWHIFNTVHDENDQHGVVRPENPKYTARERYVSFVCTVGLVLYTKIKCVLFNILNILILLAGVLLNWNTRIKIILILSYNHLGQFNINCQFHIWEFKLFFG